MKKINWKVVFKVFAWIISLAGITVLMSFINLKKQETKCVKVQILIPGADNFVEREEIESILRQSDGELVGRKLEEINIQHIENAIKQNPYIAFAKVFADMDGVISIEINQREPILRIINANGQDFYVDSKGLKMPISSNFTANVIVASGNILENFTGKVDTLLSPLGKDLYKVALYTKKDSLWDAQFEQMYVADKDIELIPRVGIQRIILGNADSLQVKMANLLAFYKQGIPMVGWNAYKTINLKYINQVVCVRNEMNLTKTADSSKKINPENQRKPIDTLTQSTNPQKETAKVASKTTASTPKPANAKAEKAAAATKTTVKTTTDKPAKTNAEPVKTEAKKTTETNKQNTDTKKKKESSNASKI